MNFSYLHLVSNIGTGILSLFGAFYCYKGVVNNRSSLSQYALWFFALNFVTSCVALVLGQIIPDSPTVDWVNRMGPIITTINIASTFVNKSAFAALAFGCYVAFRKDQKKD